MGTLSRGDETAMVSIEPNFWPFSGELIKEWKSINSLVLIINSKGSQCTFSLVEVSTGDVFCHGVVDYREDHIIRCGGE